MQAVREGGASRVAVQLVGGAGAGDRQRDAAGARDEPCGEARRRANRDGGRGLSIGFTGGTGASHARP